MAESAYGENFLNTLRRTDGSKKLELRESRRCCCRV